MAPKSGLSSQIGFALEVTPGTYVAPSVFLPLVSESMTANPEQMESEGIIAGRRVGLSTQHALGKVMPGGDVQLELYDRDLDVLLEVMFGGKSSTTFTPDADLKAFTMQIAHPGVGGTIHPYTYTGCKIESWEIGLAEGEIATLGLTISAMNEFLHRSVADGATNTNTTVTSATAAFTADDIGKPISGGTIPAGATITAVASATSVTISAAASGTATGVTLVIGVALASASYTAALIPFHFAHASVTVGGSSFATKSLTLAGDNGLDTDRHFLGSRTPQTGLEAALRVYDGTLEGEFTDLTQRRRFLNGTEHALVATLVAGSKTMTITENIYYTGQEAPVDGPGILKESLPFKAAASGADATAITLVTA